MKVTVYTLPDCVQCRQTKKMFDNADVPYNVIDLSTDEPALKMVQDLGYTSAPVVIADDKHWSGFRVEKIKNTISEFESQRNRAKESTPEGLIAVWLWRWFEYSLPTPPADLAKKIFEKLNEEGYEVSKKEPL